MLYISGGTIVENTVYTSKIQMLWSLGRRWACAMAHCVRKITIHKANSRSTDNRSEKNKKCVNDYGKIINDNRNRKILLQMKMVEQIFFIKWPEYHICSKIPTENFEFLQPFSQPPHVQQTYYW
jgi:hypothetical protein